MEQYVVALEKLAVQETSHRYAHFCDTGEIDRLVALFSDDGILDESAIGTSVIQGHAALRAFFAVAISRNSSMFHLAGNYLIDIQDSDHATGTHWQFFEGIRIDQPDKVRIIKGSFYEEFVRIDGHWRIALKRLSLLAPVHWSGSRHA